MLKLIRRSSFKRHSHWKLWEIDYLQVSNAQKIIVNTVNRNFSILMSKNSNNTDFLKMLKRFTSTGITFSDLIQKTSVNVYY